MVEKAYIGLNEDHYWILYYGDGTEDRKCVLAVGRPFKTGRAIREAMADLEQWAQENGYELVTPIYSKTEISMEDVIEPELFDEVFGSEGEDE